MFVISVGHLKIIIGYVITIEEDKKQNVLEVD